jgi:hypothetical protein
MIRRVRRRFASTLRECRQGLLLFLMRGQFHACIAFMRGHSLQAQRE